MMEAGRLAFQKALALLIKHGGDINTSARQYRALHALLQEDAHATCAKPSRQRLACLDWMLAHGADPESTGGWPPTRAIVTAAFAGSVEYVERLRKSARIDGFAAAALGERRVVEKALKVAPDFVHARDSAEWSRPCDARGTGGLTALQCAAGSRIRSKELVAITRLLLDRGADPRALTRAWGHDINACGLAAPAGNAGIFELLLDRGANPDEALWSAVWSGEMALAEMALAHGASPDRAREKDQPLLNNLIQWGQVSPALWLLERKADPNIADHRGWTAVHQAASRGNARLLRAVLEAGGDENRRDHEGFTPGDIAKARASRMVAGSGVLAGK
jgi:ankyrin repeat protein